MSITAFFILPFQTGDLVEAEQLKSTLDLYMHRRDIAGRTKSFYDEDAPDGIEYGVRLEAQNLSQAAWETMQSELQELCTMLYGNIRIDQG